MDFETRTILNNDPLLLKYMNSLEIAYEYLLSEFIYTSQSPFAFSQAKDTHSKTCTNLDLSVTEPLYLSVTERTLR